MATCAGIQAPCVQHQPIKDLSAPLIDLVSQEKLFSIFSKWQSTIREAVLQNSFTPL